MYSPDRALDDALIWGWNGLNIAHPPNDLVRPDVWRLRYWTLLHHGGFFTYPHHDANGLATWIIPEAGFKFWGILRPKGLTGYETRESYVDLMHKSLAVSEEPKGKDTQGPKSAVGEEEASEVEEELNPERAEEDMYKTRANMWVVFAQPGDIM